MKNLTLEWIEGSEVRNYTIDARQLQDTQKTIKIGRDPDLCDLVFSEDYSEHLSISRCHIEISFKLDWNHFYLKNLKPQNPPLIDGGILVNGEVVLHPNSIIQLGKVTIKVLGVAPTEISSAKTPKSTILSHHILSVTEEYSPTVPQTIIQLNPPHIPQTNSGNAYQLQCPQCQTTHPIEARNSNCTQCGHFLADAPSIAILPSR